MAPPAGWCKINVDGSFVESTGDAGVGVVARDSAGVRVQLKRKPGLVLKDFVSRRNGNQIE
nr:unnamed protein product [Digitaria exilis]CAB3481165.1 unnamed protein product [Digitaria exilis]